jgi:MinD superfamily P-loop ATPase
VHGVVVELVAQLDEARCDGCRECLRWCSYGALIWASADQTVLVDPWACTGCSACVTACSRQALGLQARGRR